MRIRGDVISGSLSFLMVGFRVRPLQSVAVFIFLVCSIYDSLQYAAIKVANASCFPKDSCNVPRDVDSLEKHNCDCGSLCGLYRTCCIDSPFLNHSRNAYRGTSCRTVGQDGTTSVFMADTCSRFYSGPQAIRKICEDENMDWSDPLANAPVTNRKSKFTYKSLFCAICNNEKRQDLMMWQLMLDCSALGEFMNVCTKNRDFVLKNIMYLEKERHWGLWSWDKKSDWKFRNLPIAYELPEELKSSVQECRPDLISLCPREWTDSITRKYCESYMGAIYFPHGAFRNMHCAICNRVKNFTEMSCHPIYSSSFRKPTTLSFGLLLDVDLRDGDTVGTTDGCTREQVYDPFSKKCRSVECILPGYKLKDGQCIKE